MRAASTYEVQCICGETVITPSDRHSTSAVCPECKRVIDVSEWRTSYERGLSA